MRDDHVQSSPLPVVSESNDLASTVYVSSQDHQLLYKQTSSRDSLDLALTNGKAAVEAATLDCIDRPKYLAGLASSHLLKYKLLEHELDLEEAFALSSEAFKSTAATNGHPHHALCSNTLSTILLMQYDRYNRNKKRERLDKAVEMASVAVRIGLNDKLNAPKFCNDLAWILSRRCEGFGNVLDLFKAIHCLEQLKLVLNKEHPDRGFCMRILGCCYSAKAARTGSVEDVNTAVAYLEEAVALSPIGFLERPISIGNLSIALRRRYEFTGCFEDLKSAVKFADECSQSQSTSPSLLAAYLNIVGTTSLKLFELENAHKKANETLDKAVVALEKAVAHAEHMSHPDLPMYLGNLCLALSTKAEFGGTHAEHTRNLDINKAIVAGQKAISLVSEGNPRFSGICKNLGNALLERYREQQGSENDLNLAIDAYTACYRTTGLDSPEWATASSNLSNALIGKFKLTGNQTWLTEAIELLQTAVLRSRDNHPEVPILLNILSNALLERYRLGGKVDDLNAAIIDGSRAAKISCDINHPDRRIYLSTFANALVRRFHHFGNIDDLELAKSNLMSAIDWEREYPDKFRQMNNLANVHALLYGRLLSLSNLNQAIEYRKLVLKLIGTHPDRAMYLFGLVNDLGTRAGRTRFSPDREQAIKYIEEAVNLTPREHPSRALYLDAKGAALLLDNYHSLEMVGMSITAYETALESTLDEVTKAQICHNLAFARLTRFRLTKSPIELDSALVSSQNAINSEVSNPRNALLYRHLFAKILQTRFGATGQDADICEAIDEQTRIVEATPLNENLRGCYLCSLGDALLLRNGSGDSDLATKAFAEAARLDSAGATFRVLAAKKAAKLLLSANQQEARSLLVLAVKIMQDFAPLQGDQVNVQKRIASLYGTASDAAALTLECNLDPAEAVALLDVGRFIVLGRRIDVRADVKGLPDDLRDAYESLRDILDQPIHTQQPESYRGNGDIEFAELRHQAAVKFEALKYTIRQVDGFHSFGLPFQPQELMEAAAIGPIVVLNINAIRSDALLVTKSGTVSQRLHVTPSSVVEQIQSVRMIGNRIRKARMEHNNTMVDQLSHDLRAQGNKLLEWLWDSIAEPVLQKLGYTTPHSEGDEWPRVWWCPVGILSSLPIHAAGYHGDLKSPGRTVLDRVVSSYTSSIRTLKYSRTHAAPRTTHEVRIMTMPTTPGQATLGWVRDEAFLVKRIMKVASQLNNVVREEHITTQRLHELLPEATIAHFACHALFDPKDPSASQLVLKDRGVKVSEIAQYDLRKGALAYLSACRTAFTGLSAWDDEAITLTSAFQVAGFSHVVGTLWDADDNVALQVAKSFYEFLGNDLSRSAYALHCAILQQRDQNIARPYFWAPYIYTGA